jgi:hypothetical protein
MLDFVLFCFSAALFFTIQNNLFVYFLLHPRWLFRGMTSPMDDRNTLLKEMKRSFGSGGTLSDGVLEIQGSYAIKAGEGLKTKVAHTLARLENKFSYCPHIYDIYST